jgi:hypothetical protein
MAAILDNSMAASTLANTIDKYWVDEMMRRWRLSVEYIDGLESDSVPAQDALRHVLYSDLPLVMKELTRLRPELTLS